MFLIRFLYLPARYQCQHFVRTDSITQVEVLYSLGPLSHSKNQGPRAKALSNCCTRPTVCHDKDLAWLFATAKCQWKGNSPEMDVSTKYTQINLAYNLLCQGHWAAQAPSECKVLQKHCYNFHNGCFTWNFLCICFRMSPKEELSSWTGPVMSSDDITKPNCLWL